MFEEFLIAECWVLKPANRTEVESGFGACRVWERVCLLDVVLQVVHEEGLRGPGVALQDVTTKIALRAFAEVVVYFINRGNVLRCERHTRIVLAILDLPGHRVAKTLSFPWRVPVLCVHPSRSA